MNRNIIGWIFFGCLKPFYKLESNIPCAFLSWNLASTQHAKRWNTSRLVAKFRVSSDLIFPWIVPKIQWFVTIHLECVLEFVIQLTAWHLGFWEQIHISKSRPHNFCVGSSTSNSTRSNMLKKKHTHFHLVILSVKLASTVPPTNQWLLQMICSFGAISAYFSRGKHLVVLGFSRVSWNTKTTRHSPHMSFLPRCSLRIPGSPGSIPKAMEGGKSVTKIKKRICNGVLVPVWQTSLLDLNGCFLKNGGTQQLLVFLLNMIILWCFGGYHHLRKHPNDENLWIFVGKQLVFDAPETCRANLPQGFQTSIPTNVGILNT